MRDTSVKKTFPAVDMPNYVFIFKPLKIVYCLQFRTAPKISYYNFGYPVAKPAVAASSPKGVIHLYRLHSSLKRLKI